MYIDKDEVIEELVSLLVKQHGEIKRLTRRVDQIKQYIDVYEDYIKRDDNRGNSDTGANFREE